MAIGVDTSKWKPRKIKGTPAATFRNFLGAGALSIGLACGVFFHFTSITENLRKSVYGLYEDPIEEVERRQMIASGLPNRSDTRQCVRSKYFISKTAMDESLSDFQETKHSCKGPKTAQKVVKTKSRKVTKRIKGQKDIRTALKGKKNELLSYTKEFENVCKKSGIDVDSEHLQVAIALSKSLQTEVTDDVSTSQQLTTQGRIAKIKTTLREYGFKVPDTKITINRKIKKHRKQYKLLNITEEEKHQKIRNKYSQILFQTLDYELSVGSSYQSCTPIYSLATNLEYEFMKNNNIFYVNSLANIIERSTKIGSLLRNWAEIPGRPISPQLLKKSTMDFSEIVCSQDELDVILSGSIKSAHRIIETKKLDKAMDIDCTITKVELESEGNKEIIEIRNKDDKFDHITIDVDKEVHLNENISISPATEILKCENVIVIASNSTLTDREQYRSCSPDIFDDEVSCIMESTKKVSSQGQKTEVFTEEGNSMDLTECANIHFEKASAFPKSLSINATKIIHDDYMEMTECAISASQGIKGNVNEIDLTQSPDEKSIIEKNCYALNYIAESPEYSFSQRNLDIADHTVSDTEEDNKSIVDKISIECIDFITNSSIANNKIGTIGELHVDNPSDNIDLTQSSNENENNILEHNNKTTIIQEKDVSNEKIESMYLTQSSKSSVESGDLPEINLGNTQKCQINLDDTIILKEVEYLSANDNVKKLVVTEDDQIFDLTQAGEEFTEANDHFSKEKISELSSQSFYEDFIHDHSDSHENNTSVVHGNENNSGNNLSKENLDIDLTQTSDSSTESNDSPKPITVKNIPNNSSLGKKDDISIDYDEICEDEGDESSRKENSLNLDQDSSNVLPQTDNDVEIVDSNNDLTSNASQTSEVFDLTDKELDYSLYKSRLDLPIANFDYDFEGISVMNDNNKNENLKNSLSYSASKSCTLEESFLPEVNIRNGKIIEEKDEIDACSSSNKEHNTNHSSDRVPVVTPKNSEYVIKTNNVTPMLDYALLTTPQRNKELDKYGLKPFKRKRAIQILTHLYNQTHPVIETYLDDEQQSPPKKRRQDSSIPLEVTPTTLPLQSPRKLESGNPNAKSPRKQVTMRSSKSPRNIIEDNENMNSPRKKQNCSQANVNTYEITSDLPNIKCVHCDPEDWVFQKREKAKVHSCRVPLHIAFHNYVSSRRSLREAILKYEPVNIDIIHKDLVSYGHRYDPKDLLRFLDKKCITVKTADNNARNKI
ncbi:unnamed protein product [Arctia plantaginis]|uniref:Structure-specific endonuclease subunit SLX4 n=1 Tax=Arctia plantaginis TaxID=874455 RepID=A0A8S0YNY7_ARCPL|nr:unnamed protein product [Arctia plantaginis]